MRQIAGSDIYYVVLKDETPSDIDEVKELKKMLLNIYKANRQYIRDAREWSPCSHEGTVRHIEIYLESMNYEIDKELLR